MVYNLYWNKKHTWTQDRDVVLGKIWYVMNQQFFTTLFLRILNIMIKYIISEN